MKVKEFLEKMKKTLKPRYRNVKGTRNIIKVYKNGLEVENNNPFNAYVEEPFEIELEKE